MKPSRIASEANFIESAFYRAFGEDLPHNCNKMESHKKNLYSQVCKISAKLSVRDLTLLSSVMDGNYVS